MLNWKDDKSFTIDNGVTEYACRPLGHGFVSKPGRFCLLKDRRSVALYEQVLRETRPRTIFEVGVYEGGSTAFFAELTQPDTLIAVDLEARPRPALDHFVALHALQSKIVIHDEVDQADTARLNEILATDLGDRPLDLVVDDASHLVTQTRATFNCLFPRLRAGGTYVIEDWSWAHRGMPLWPDEVPLTALVLELVLACARHPAILADVTVNRSWARITRGDAELDAPTFDVSSLLDDRGQALVNRQGSP